MMQYYKGFNFCKSYSFEKALMLWAGLYPNQNDIHVLTYYTCFMLVFLCQSFMELAMIIFVIQNFKQVEKITQTVLFLATESAFIIKLILVAYYRDKFISLERILNGDVFSKVSMASTGDISSDAKNSRKILTAYWIIAAGTCSVFCFSPLLWNDFRLAVPIYKPYDLTVPVNYYWTFGYATFSHFMCAILNTAFDTMFGMFCTLVYIRLKTLKNSLRCLNYEMSSENVSNELKNLTLLYLEILRVTKIIEQIFSYGILFQFAASVFVICFTVFQILLVPELYLFLYFGCMLSQVAIFCYYGHFVMTESSDIGQAIYLSNWYVSDVKNRKDILILMERFKKPVTLTAGKLFPVNMQTFTGILRCSYSFFAVLRQMEI